jgi:hypothetical protein
MRDQPGSAATTSLSPWAASDEAKARTRRGSEVGPSISLISLISLIPLSLFYIFTFSTFFTRTAPIEAQAGPARGSEVGTPYPLYPYTLIPLSPVYLFYLFILLPLYPFTLLPFNLFYLFTRTPWPVPRPTKLRSALRAEAKSGPRPTKLGTHCARQPSRDPLAP